MENGVVLLDHGSGGLAAGRLIQEFFLSRLGHEELHRLEDSAELALDSRRIAFTTDSYVVDPPFFPGGNIGHLAVHGTVNDLAVRGARPLFMSLALILEEGLPLSELDLVAETVAQAARECGVQVVTGDTKVVPRGKGDRIFINTAGIGILDGPSYSVSSLEPGDILLVSGPVGQHGMAVMAARAGIDLGGGAGSDTAPVWEMVEALASDLGAGLHAMRDPTRGGLATVLCEMAEASGVEIEVEERAVPVASWVRGLAEVMGLDPFYLANEGRLVLGVAEGMEERALAVLRSFPQGAGAEVIGRVTSEGRGGVVCLTAAGGSRPLRRLHGDPLPRIC